MRTSIITAHLGEPVYAPSSGRFSHQAVTALSNRYDENLIKQAIDYISGKDSSADKAKESGCRWVLEEVAYFVINQELEAEGVDAKNCKINRKDGLAFVKTNGLDIACQAHGNFSLMSEVGKLMVL